MFKLSKNSLNDLMFFREGLSCVIKGKDRSGLTSFSIDLATRILQENNHAHIKIIASTITIPKILNYMNRSFLGKDISENTQDDFFKANEFKDRFKIKGFNTTLYIDNFLEFLDKEKERFNFNVLLIDDTHKIMHSVNKEETLFLLVRWCQQNKVQLILNYNISQVKLVIESVPCLRMINSIFSLEESNNKKYLSITRNIKMSSFKFALSFNEKCNNYFEDYHIGSRRRHLFCENYTLKNKSYMNSFLINDEMDSIIEYTPLETFISSNLEVKSSKLKNEIIKSTLVENKLVDLDVINYILLCEGIFNQVDVNFIKKVIKEKSGFNKINPLFFEKESLPLLGELFKRVNVTLKNFTDLFINSTEAEFNNLLKLSIDYLDIKHKELEFDINFFKKKYKNINSISKIFEVLREVSQKVYDYKEIIQNQLFFDTQKKIEYLNDSLWGDIRIKAISNVNDLFHAGIQLCNCLGNQRYINYIANNHEHIIILYLENDPIAAVHFNKDFEIIEMKKKYNEEFSIKDQNLFKLFLKSLQQN